MKNFKLGSKIFFFLPEIIYFFVNAKWQKYVVGVRIRSVTGKDSFV